MQNSHMNHTKPTYSPLKSPGNRTRLFNGVTSTPLSSQNAHLKSSLFLRNKLTPLQSPPLYNLSETSNSNKSPAPIQNISGPLLASTKFNVSLGTYTDTKSPGLTNRIVQYDNEAKQMLAPTHQAKYGSPGLFPIVHFFKQDIPTISPKPKKVTVKIASPDASWYNNTEYNTKNIGNRNANVQNGPSVTQTNADTETRSVLDALKEISRKRIHTTSDFDIEQDVCKRQKRSEKVLNPSETNKRVREEDLAATDLQGKTSGPPPAKKICVVDMLAASYTSSRLYKEKLEKGLKKKTEVDIIDKIDPKPRKLLTIGTQTADRLDKVEKSKDIEVEMTDCTALKSSDPIVKEKESKPLVKPTEPPRSNLIFDEKRLEISRKNRLATLLSALTGEPPQYIQYEKSKSATESENGTTPTNSPIKLVSILSPQNKPKHDKHVTFNLPPEQKEITSITSSISSTAVTTTTMESLPSAQTVSTPSKDLITSSIETPKSAVSAPMGIKLNFETNTSTTKEAVKVEESKASESNLGGIAFKTSATTSATTTVSSPFAFGVPTSVSSSNIISSMPTSSVTTVSKEPSSPQKSGGFKFDLGKSPSSATKNTIDVNVSTMIPKFNFNTTSSGQTESSSVTKSISLPGFCMPQSTSVVTPTFTFGDNQSKPSSVQVNDTAITMIPTDKKAGFGDVKFGNVTSPMSVNPVSSAVSMQSPQLSTGIVTTNPTSLFGFTAAKQPALPSTQTSQSANTVTTFGGFGALPAIAPSTQSPAFGVTTSAIPSFGVDFSNTAPTSTNTSFGAFGTPTTTAVAPSFVPTTTTSMFGNPTPTISSFTSPGLVTSTIPTFATPTTTEKMFNPNTTSSGLFVTNPASQSFNATTTTTTASSGMFGAAPESKPFSFGANQSNVGGDNSFNTPNTKSGFNFTSNTTPSSTSLKPVSSFGSPNVFGSTAAPNANIASNVFKSPSAGNFGSAQFGSKTENAAFGSKVENQNTFGSFNNSFGTSTNAAGGFGTNNNNNNANTFGTPANTAGGFGTNTNNNNNNSTNNVNTFGTPTNSAGGFGTNTNSNNNNNTNAFGTNTANTTFGANSSAFGTNPTNKAFGTNTNPTFPITQNPTSGFTSPQNNFGQAAQNTNTFGAPPPTNNANNSTFPGANIFGNAAASNTSNFGFTGGDSASAFSKPAAGAFGGASAAGDTAFQFGGGGNAPATNQGFAGNATNAPPSGGQSNVFAFGSPSQPAAPTGGVFTFGTADVKPAFNFSAGSNAAPSFGAGAANFNPAPAQNAFNPPQFGGAGPGVFSIGSGSTSGPRNRNQLKGKRRV